MNNKKISLLVSGLFVALWAFGPTGYSYAGSFPRGQVLLISDEHGSTQVETYTWSEKVSAPTDESQKTVIETERKSDKGSPAVSEYRREYSESKAGQDVLPPDEHKATKVETYRKSDLKPGETEYEYHMESHESNQYSVPAPPPPVENKTIIVEPPNKETEVVVAPPAPKEHENRLAKWWHRHFRGDQD